MKQSEAHETSRFALEQITENIDVAKKEKLPLCQDTGTAVFLVDIGHLVQLEQPLIDVLTTAVDEAYRENYLRASMVADPVFARKNTGNNCPPIVHLHQTKGDALQITFLPKGGGAENKSILKMLRPADGVDGVKKTILEAVQNAGGAACPPWIIGVGIGSSFDSVGELAKKALVRPLGSWHSQKEYAALEQELANEINQLSIGALGFGGKQTAMAVHIETAPTHMASLPVAVNLQCHSARSAVVVL
jgi:fumarate hydratase subunit alpha